MKRKGLLCFLLLLACLCFSSAAYAATVNVDLLNNEKRVISYRKGQKITLLRYGQHIRQASYKSSNPSVASVNPSGVIRTKRPGKTVITVKARGHIARYRLKVTANNTPYDLANKYGRGMRYFIFLDRGARKVYVLR